MHTYYGLDCLLLEISERSHLGGKKGAYKHDGSDDAQTRFFFF